MKNLQKKKSRKSIKKKKILKEINDNPNEHAFRNAPDAITYPEPDDFASGGRVPLKFGKMPESKDIDTGVTKLDTIPGARESQKLRELLNKLREDRASDGRVPMVFGGRTIGVLKNLLTKMKKSHGVGRGEKSLKPDPIAKKIMTADDKIILLQLETQYANSVLESLKIDRQLFKQLQANSAMKDQGLDFLMKNFVDTQVPHMKNYRSLADIDQAILELETVVKNKTLKEGRQLNATGGRVPLVEGGTPSAEELEQYYRNLEEEKKRKRREREFYDQRFGGPGPILEAASGGLAHMLGE